MKNLVEFMNECFESELNNVNEQTINESEIKDEKSFREYAEKKFKKVFGDKLDEKKMNDTIDGLLKDNADAIKEGDWGKLVGLLNKSFGA